MATDAQNEKLNADLQRTSIDNNNNNNNNELRSILAKYDIASKNILHHPRVRAIIARFIVFGLGIVPADIVDDWMTYSNGKLEDPHVNQNSQKLEETDDNQYGKLIKFDLLFSFTTHFDELYRTAPDKIFAFSEIPTDVEIAAENIDIEAATVDAATIIAEANTIINKRSVKAVDKVNTVADAIEKALKKLFDVAATASAARARAITAAKTAEAKAAVSKAASAVRSARS